MSQGMPEEALDLDETDEKMIKDLEEALKDKMPIDRIFMIRFVRGYKKETSRWETTLTKITEALEWRQQTNADTILNEPIDDEEEFSKMWPRDFHGISKNGHPIYIEDSCCTDPGELLQRFSVEQQQKFHIQMMETLDAIKKQQSRKSKCRTYKHIVIMDLNNLGRKHMSSKFSDPIKSQINIDQYYYPECLHRLYIVNAPWVFRMVWAMVKPWLHPLTAAKACILGSDFSEKLKEELGATAVPRYLGGECSCCPDKTPLKDMWKEKFDKFVELRNTLLKEEVSDDDDDKMKISVDTK